MRYEEISLEFSNYIWYLLTHSEYKEPPKRLYKELTNRIRRRRYNADKFYSCENMRNILIQIKEDIDNKRNVCICTKTGMDKFNDEFYHIVMNINELMNDFNSDNISIIVFMNEMNKVVQRLNNLLINSYSHQD